MSTIDRTTSGAVDASTADPDSASGTVRDGVDSAGDAVQDVTDSVADTVDDAVRDNPMIERLTRLGWIAKGVIYILMGATAISIAQQQRTDDDASPKGALDRVIEQPGGRFLLGVLAVGLVLYCLWRILSVAVIRSNDLSAWLDRIGYTFSAVFYAVLAWVAARGALLGADPERDNTVERLSQSVMDSTLGRGAVMLAGIVTFVVGAFFVVRKGLMRSFADDLSGVRSDRSDDLGEHVLVAAGVAGWIGRGIVTMLVGFFVTRAAWRFDPEDARGFDGALRRVATTSTGTVLVWVAAVGLILYGGFCLLSHRRRALKEYCA